MSLVVIIGAGQAGASLAARLRSKGFDGSITMIGAEPAPPYQRPPLSKKYLLGEMALERLFLRPENFYADQNIDLRVNASVTAIDRAKKTVSVGGETLPYDMLALTTGSAPRRLPAAIGGALPGVYTMRDLADADALAPHMAAGKKLLIVGGGYIGLEAAAVAASRGLEVTLIEAAPRILQRVAAPETADYFRALHQSHGVTLIEGTGLERLLGETHVTGARLADGREIACDLAIVGIGITPETALAEAAGLALENGIQTNSQCQTSDPAIWAAGDCASFPWQGGRLRLESVPNAIDMAECVADNMLGEAREYHAKPWFWSDQYDVKLQIAGLNAGYDRTILRPGDKPGTQSVWYYKGETLLAVDAMNDARAYMIGKRLVEAGKSPAPETVADPATDLKSLV
ncbi:MAG: pyridine nucleotide-disulfide oxidoreductase [Rhodobacteraceae bacterium]|nr:pyridine nucleotide-disulfide oxidoreductase [Paracoccaceae bacterium]